MFRNTMFKPDRFSYRSLYVFFVAGLLLSACSDPNVAIESDQDAAIFDVTVEKNLILNEPRCFLNGVFASEGRCEHEYSCHTGHTKTLHPGDTLL